MRRLAASVLCVLMGCAFVARAEEIASSHGMRLQEADPRAIGGDFFGGTIKNRKTSELLALKCAESDAGGCTGFHFYLIPASASSPADYVNLNPNVIFRADDLKRLESSTKNKIKYRVNPNGFVAPVFGGTMLVWVLVQQNRTGGGPRLPLEALYVIAVPVDAATAIPIVAGSAAVFGAKRGVIAIQRENIKRAFQALSKPNRVKKLGGKNFELLKTLIQQYR